MALPVLSFSGTVDLPKTGQKTCYDSSGNVIDCNGTGQDGEIQAGIQLNEGLVAEWHFDEGSGNILRDTSGSGNDGTIYGATWTTHGKFGSALQFDGVNDYVEVPDSPELSGGTGKDMTIEFWFNSNKQWGDVITKWKDVSYKDWGSIIGGFGAGLNFWYETGGRDRRFYGGSIQEGVWHHGAFTFQRATGDDNAVLKMYIDGNEIKLTPFYQDGVPPNQLYDMPDTTAPVSIGYSGKYYNTGFFDGKIDEIKIYGRVLSSDEIRAEYQKGTIRVCLGVETAPASVRPGDTVRTEVRVQNGDNPRLAYVSARVSGPMGDESDLGYTSYHFAPNETRTFAFQYTVPDDADLGMYDLAAQLYEDCAGTCSNPIGLSFVANDVFEVSDEADIEPPAAIDDLSAEPGDNRGEIQLGWTATGNDGYIGKAAGYIVKYATVPVTDVNWGSAGTYEQNWMPEDPGVRETHILYGFSPGQELFFALKTVDEVLNASPVSNTASAEASSAEGANYVNIPGTDFRIIAKNINYTSDSEVEATGNVSLNDLIFFSGLVRIDLQNAIISGEGNVFMPDVPLMGDVYLFEGGFEFNLGELIESNLEAISRVAGIDLQIDSMKFLWKDLKPDGISISAEMTFPEYLASGAVNVNNLVISRTDGISGAIDLDPEGQGIQIKGCNWKLKEGKLSFDSQRGLFNGHGKLDMAKFDLTADISFIEGQLYGVGMCYGCPEPGKVILIASGVPIIYLQEVCGEVENIPDPSKLILRATADITAGPEIQDCYLVGLDDAGMEIDISSRATLSGTMILGGSYELADAEAYLDWHKVLFGASGTLNALGIYTGLATFTIDGRKNISGSAEGNLSVPDVWYYWPLRGEPLTNVLSFFNNNGIKGQVEVQLPFFGSLSAAFAFDWNGNFSVAENLESLGSQTYMASQQRLLSLEGQLMPVYVPEGMDVIYIKVTWTGDGDSIVELVKPDSTRITPGSCGADPDCYYQDDAPQEAWYALRDPDSGQWQVDIIDPTNLGDIAVDVLSSNSKPFIQLNEPSVDISTSTSADISWVDSDPDDNASVSLWYDVDQHGYDGSLIISGINEDDGADSYVWDVTSIPTGRYYLYAQIDDGKNAPLRCYAPGMVEVVNPLYPGTPTNLQATVNGKVVELSWDAVADCVYMLHYTDNITSRVYDSYFSLTDENHWITDAALAGKEVKFAVQAVQTVEIGEGQTEMRASLVSTPVIVTIPDRPGISVEPAVIEFGDVSPGTSTVKVATISNMGNEDLRITCLKFVGSDKEAFHVDKDCPLTIGPGANEPIGIELIPNKQGAYSALFQIFSDDPQKAICEIGLSATVNDLGDGDFDDDRDVDGSDLSAFVTALGFSSGSANYNPDADFDENGVVDESDLSVFAGKFGREL